jgi:hypothetical protein
MREILLPLWSSMPHFLLKSNLTFENLSKLFRFLCNICSSRFQEQYRQATTRYVSEVQTQPVSREFVNKAPIIEEHVSRKVVEEVQPVLYRETVAPVLIEETQPIYEKVVEAPVIIEEVRQTVDLGTKVQPLSSSMQNMSLNEPFLQQPLNEPFMQKETIVSKEVFPAEDLQRAERSSFTESKHIV